GENPLESRNGAPEEFMSHPRWQRFVIAIAGPAMNIILAVALLTGVFMVHYEHPVFLDAPAVIGWVQENSPAAKAGIEQGDRIVRIDGTQNSVVGWLPDQPITVTELDPDMPAAKAGLKVGDDIVAVNGTAMRSLFSVIHLLQQNGSKPVDVTLVRDGQKMNLQVTPVLTDENGQKTYRLGFRSEPVRVDKLSFPQALNRSLEENKKYSLLIVDLVQKMLQR